MPEPALGPLAGRLGRHRRHGVLLDANVLVVHIIGAADPRWVGRVGSTEGYSGKDAALLSAIVASVDRLVTTPHVLTEVNGLLNVGGLGHLRHRVLNAFSGVVGGAVEIREPAAAISVDPAFPRLGLTDAALLALAPDGPLVVSADGDLCKAILSRGHEVVHYNGSA